MAKEGYPAESEEGIPEEAVNEDAPVSENDIPF
jgi:hypothetical protein